MGISKKMGCNPLMRTAAMLLLGLTSGFAQQSALYRVNCGGEAFVDKAGHLWEGDSHYQGGSTFAAQSEILNTDTPGLYQTERWNDTLQGNLQYRFTVPVGEYKVNLHFAEVYDQAFAQGQRVFDVKINGAVVAADLDIFAQAGANTPVIADYLASAAEGAITVEFANKKGNAKISGIEVLPQNPFRATAAPYRIHCGGEEFIDPQGHYWEGDGHFTGGSTFQTANTVSNTDKSAFYQTERWNGTGDLAYSFDVTDGAYDVRLHFAEIFFQAAGERVFGVDINGEAAVENLDIWGEAGANVALVKEFTARAVGGKITVAFRNGTQNAKISGIEILPAATTRSRLALRNWLGGNIAIEAAGAGSLSIRAAASGPVSALVTDYRGRRAASLKGMGNLSVSGLRPGLYLVRANAGGRTYSRSVSVL